MTSSVFCDECGAANPAQATLCFACQGPLPTVAPSPIVQATTVQTPVTPTVAVAPSPQLVASSLPVSHPVAPGTLFKRRYYIIEQVGKGGFGVVYKARDRKRMNRLVAVKQIDIHALPPRKILDATDSYNREVRLLSMLKHRQLPRIYDTFADRDHWYIVMDFVRGETLEEYRVKRAARPRRRFFGLLSAKNSAVGAEGLPMREVLNIGIQLCKVLDYLHRQQPPIIFRDVKPDNIMRTPLGRLYLIDFGIARRFAAGQSRDTGPLGSPGYAAPEQYGTTQTTPQTDVYGLGATLQTLLTGAEPLAASSTGASAPVLPEKLQHLLDQMLEPDVSKRPKSIYTVQQRLIYVKEGIAGLVARGLLAYGGGLLLGSVPFSLVMFLSGALQWVNTSPVGAFSALIWLFFILAYALLCLWPFVLVGHLVVASLLLFSQRRRFGMAMSWYRRVIALGILSMVTLILATILFHASLPSTFREFIPNLPFFMGGY